jgi:serine/threonine protein phosphatase PrpC
MSSDPLPQIEVYGLSDVGKVREDNQDAIRCCQPDDPAISFHGHTVALADGMGGYEHGGLASATALEVFFDALYSSNSSQPMSKLKQAVQNANLGVFQKAQRLGAVRMGTTLTAANLVGDKLFVAHVGDSRLYLVRDGKATCLTNDHTTVGELVRMRVLSPDKVRTHNQRSILNKCLGIDMFVQPDVAQFPLQEGDVLILCSDGVWAVVQDDEFADFAAQTPDMESLSRSLIDLAMERDSDDNASVVAVRVDQLASVPVLASARRGFGLPGFLRNRLSGNV